MQNSFISSLLLDLVAILKSNKDFFDLDKAKRQEALKPHQFSSHLNQYFSSVDKKHFLEDLEEVAKNQLRSIYRQNRISGVRLAELLSTYFDRKIDYNFEEATGNKEGNHFILVQSPVKLDPEFEDKIRETLLKKFPRSAPVFSINKKIGGGMRIFIDGVIEDHSWAAKLSNLSKKS